MSDASVLTEASIPSAPVAPIPARRRSSLFEIVGRGWRALKRSTEFVFNLVWLVLLLALLAAIPVVNLLPLGMMLAGEGQVARTGRLLPGIPLRRAAGQIGVYFMGAILFLLPLSYLGSFASDAAIIDPESPRTLLIRTATAFAAMVVFVHLLLSILRGPRLGHFFSPWRNIRWGVANCCNGEFLNEAGTALQNFVAELELGRHFRLGAIGAVGVLMWTFLPTTLFAVADSSRGGAVFVTIIGGIALAIVLCWLPILQAHYAAEQKFRAYRGLRHARLLFRRSPCLWTLVLLLGFTLSLVLYLFKVAAPPRDAVFLLTPFFIATIYPARLAAGGVYAWSNHRTKIPWWGWRWFWNLTCFGICLIYVFLLFFTRNIGANGKLVLYEQPFLLIPSPF